jgi:hypothetical protein
MSLIVVVLGMARSGTSCLTRILHRAGMYLGEEELGTAAFDNLEGYMEATEPFEIDSQILRLSGAPGPWDPAPKQLVCDAETTARMVRFLDKLRQHPVSGWKDPRTTLTFGAWKPHLGHYRVVACVRHPMNVVRSLQVRHQWPLAQALGLWTMYNECLLRYLEAERDFHLFDFDAPAEILAARARSICASLGLRADQDETATFNPYLRHHTEPEPIPDAHAEVLYARLKELARAQSPVASTMALPTQAGYEQVMTRLGQLARVQHQENEVVQQLRLAQGQAGEKAAALEQRCHRLEEELRALHARLTQVERNLLLRVVRKATRLLRGPGRAA